MTSCRQSASTNLGSFYPCVALVLIAALAPVRGHAHTMSTAAEPNKPPPTGLRLGSLNLTVTERVRVEHWDWFDGSPPADGSYTFGASLLRFGVGQTRNRHDWQFELAQPTLLGLPDDAIAPPPQGQLGFGGTYFAANRGRDASVFVKQAFVRFKRFGDRKAMLRLGRFEFFEGAEVVPKDLTLAAIKRDRIAHRLIGNFGFTHVGRSFDGFQYVHDAPRHNVTLLLARPTEGVFQLNGMEELNVDVAYAALTRPLHFKGPEKAPMPSGEGRLFGLYYHDGRNVTKTDNRPGAVRVADTNSLRLGTVGGHYLRAFRMLGGKGDFLFWGARQFGHWGTQTHAATGLAAELGYQPKGDSMKTHLRLGYGYGSGDNNAADGAHKTFFQVLPTPRVYARFPFFNLMNHQDLFASVSMRPAPRWSLRADAHALKLADENDLWYVGGGAFQKSSFGYVGRPSGLQKSLATLFDLSVDYQPARDTTMTLYLGRASGHGVIGSIYPAGRHASLMYVEMSRKF